MVSRYIDANALTETIRHFVDTMSVCTSTEYCTGLRFMKKQAIEAVENAPTVDAVPVVRCRECKHSMKVDGMIGLVWCDQVAEVGAWVENDFYCADGERKDNTNLKGETK